MLNKPLKIIVLICVEWSSLTTGFLQPGYFVLLGTLVPDRFKTQLRRWPLFYMSPS